MRRHHRGERPGRRGAGASANHGDAALIHGGHQGRMAGEQILKLRTLGLTEEEAEEKIVEGS